MNFKLVDRKSNDQAVKFTWKKSMHANLSLLKLINVQFWQSKSSPLFAYMFSCLFLGVYGYVMLAIGNEETFKQTIAGVIVMNIMHVGIEALPQTIVEFKNQCC